MKLFLFGVFLCICASQVQGVYKTYAELKQHCAESPNEELTPEEIVQDNQLYSSIKGISPQAFDDFSKISKKQCLIYHPLKAMTIKLIPSDVKSGETAVDEAFFKNFFEVIVKEAVTEEEDNEFIEDIRNLPEDQLDQAKKDRFITYFKGFSRGATLDDVKATFGYLYGKTF